MFKIHFSLIRLAITTVLLTSAVHAQDAAVMEVIEVTGRADSNADYSFSSNRIRQDIVDISQSISVVTQELLKEQGIVRLNDITPFVSGANEFSVYNDITIRGFRSSDDRRVNGYRTYNNFWSQDIVAHVDRIEIIKGSSAAMFGDASPGGVINMITKKPLNERNTEVFARLGSYSDHYVALDTTGPFNDQLLYRLNVAHEDAESFRHAQVNKNTIVAPSLTWIASDRTRLNLDVVHIDSQSVLDRGQPNFRNSQTLGAIPIEVSLTQPGDKLDTTSTGVTLTLDQKITEGWHLAAAYNNYDYDEKMVEHRIGRFQSDSTISLNYNDRDSDAEVNTWTGYITGEFFTGEWQHNLVAGVDLTELEEEQRDLYVVAVDVVDLNDLANLNRPRNVDQYQLDIPSWSPFGGNMENLGIYVQHQLSRGPWQVMLGLRHDDFTVNSFEREVVSSASGTQLSPRFSALYKLNEHRSVYASYITGFQPPDTWNNAPQYGGPFEPQDSELMEIGYKQRLFSGRALLSMAVYELTKNNAIVSAQDDSNPDLYIQRGEETAHGFELEFSGQATERLSIATNYAYNDARITDDPNPDLEGSRKEGAPQHMATVWGKYQISSSIHIGLGAEYVGKRATFVKDLTLPSYTLFNAGLFYEPNDSLSVAFQARNLSDEIHWTGGYNYGRLFPGNPRTYSLSVNYRL